MNSELAVLASSAEFRHLTRQQKLWLVGYLTNGSDSLAATRRAYPGATPKSQAVMASQILHAPGIVDALEVWKWRSANARTQLLSQAEYQLAHCDPGSVSAQRLLSQIERLTIGIPHGRRALEDEDLDAEVHETPAPAENVAATPQIPEGATAWYDKTTGVMIGYRSADGRDVQLHE